MLQAIGYPIGYPQGTVWNHYWLFAFSQVVMLAMGIYLMVKSRDVTAFLFKDEEE